MLFDGEYMLYRMCTRCCTEKTTDNFRVEKRTKIGLVSWCRPCEKAHRQENKEKYQEYNRTYYEANKEFLKAYQKVYNEANPEKIKERNRKYYVENIDKFVEYRKANADRIRQAAREYRLKHKEKISAYMKVYMSWYVVANREKLLEQKRNKYHQDFELNQPKVAAYKRANRSKFNAGNAKRRANKLERTPSWLTVNQHEEMNMFYIEAKTREKETGIKFHVDHIVPLLGETVCGLHVPWNLQVITAYDNLVKGNRLL